MSAEHGVPSSFVMDPVDREVSSVGQDSLHKCSRLAVQPMFENEQVSRM